MVSRWVYKRLLLCFGSIRSFFLLPGSILGAKGAGRRRRQSRTSVRAGKALAQRRRGRADHTIRSENITNRNVSRPSGSSRVQPTYVATLLPRSLLSPSLPLSREVRAPPNGNPPLHGQHRRAKRRCKRIQGEGKVDSHLTPLLVLYLILLFSSHPLSLPPSLSLGQFSSSTFQLDISSKGSKQKSK